MTHKTDNRPLLPGGWGVVRGRVEASKTSLGICVFMFVIMSTEFELSV